MLFAILLLTSACGYHFSGEGPGPKPGLKSISIPVFGNETSEPDLGSMFAEALRREFIIKGPLEVVPTESAEAIIKGKVKQIYSSAVAHRAFEQTIESRLYVTLDIRCVDAQTGKVLWQDPDFKYYKVYLQSSDEAKYDPIVNFENRRQALEFLAKEMAVRIHDRFLSNF